MKKSIFRRKKSKKNLLEIKCRFRFFFSRILIVFFHFNYFNYLLYFNIYNCFVNCNFEFINEFKDIIAILNIINLIKHKICEIN